MTGAVADSLMHEIPAEAMRDWGRGSTLPSLSVDTGPLSSGRRPRGHPYNSYGNGAAMRVSPVAGRSTTETPSR